MKKLTVKQRITQTNAVIVILTFLGILLINVFLAKVYVNLVEDQFIAAFHGYMSEADLKNVIENILFKRASFVIIVIVDLLLCVLVFHMISTLFTKLLSQKIMTPLHLLEKGANRVSQNQLDEPILYQGDQEFEEVIGTFNEMQASILEEQEKNEAYERARREMIAGISHDLRTPLTAIKGSLKAIQDGVVRDEAMQKKFLERASVRCDEMNIMLENLFAFSKMETNHLDLNCVTISLASFFDHLARLHPDLHIHLDTSDPLVCVDENALTRIFENLIDNSHKYAKVEPMHLDLTLNSQDEFYVITYCDHGVGVKDEQLPHLFETFYRGDDSRHSQGSGLGLAVVKKLCDAMGIALQVKNDDGLTFVMTLRKGNAHE